MFKVNDLEISFIGIALAGLLYGLYSGTFAMYLQYQASKKDTNRQNIVFCSICGLYGLSVALFVVDISLFIYQFPSKTTVSGLRLYFIEMTLFSCCDFIAQFILIYRCWIVWGYNIRVVMVPSILAFAFLVIWLAAGSSTYISSGELVTPHWAYCMTLLALVLSLTVNALVTGLIVFRIFKVFREARTDQILSATSWSKLRRIVLVLIESGMVLFSIQLVRVVATAIMETRAVAFRGFHIITSIHDLLNGITPTIILVRTSMGLSFHDEESMEELAIGSSPFVSNHPNSVLETGSISNVGQEDRDAINIQGSNCVDIVEI